MAGFEPRGLDWSYMVEIGASKLGLELRGWDWSLKAQIGVMKLGLNLRQGLAPRGLNLGFKARRGVDRGERENLPYV